MLQLVMVLLLVLLLLVLLLLMMLVLLLVVLLLVVVVVVLARMMMRMMMMMEVVVVIPIRAGQLVVGSSTSIDRSIDEKGLHHLKHRVYCALKVPRRHRGGQRLRPSERRFD